MKATAPAPYDKNIVLAVRALREGKANEGQQIAAMQWIELVVCNVEGMSFHEDGDGGERASAFHEGRRFVGNQIRKMSNPITLAAAEQSRGKRQAK